MNGKKYFTLDLKVILTSLWKSEKTAKLLSDFLNDANNKSSH